ncbi:hypothetical protein DFH29DRAFT_983276 [Suillus ampliporus]|nr:hypothetical protein DFH29DRAFT_983276 [Suillus ampliporus]
MLGLAVTTLRSGLHHLETAWLFTRSDFKTIILPVMIFTNVVSPRHNPLALSCSLCWLWFHLFQGNVSNQSYSAPEDLLNKPWRPVPSGRISVKDSRALRWGLMVFCLGFSSLFNLNVVITSAVFTVLVINLLNVGAYVSFELGSTLILSEKPSLDRTSITALLCSAFVILMTIHVQDFADVNGDRMLGRRTLPIVAPEGSRIYILCVLPSISFALASFWSFGVGLRCFLVRDENGDHLNYWLYNVRIFDSYYLSMT